MKKFSIFLLSLSILALLGCKAQPTTTKNLDAFAQCLTQAGAKMYGTATCSHCQAQKALFGKSFQYVEYIDCLATPTACSNIGAVPTWIFKDGTSVQGTQELATLATKTACTLP